MCSCTWPLPAPLSNVELHPFCFGDVPCERLPSLPRSLTLCTERGVCWCVAFLSVMESDAAAAVRQYSGKPFKGSRVLIEVAKPRVRDEKEKRHPKSKCTLQSLSVCRVVSLVVCEPVFHHLNSVFQSP